MSAIERVEQIESELAEEQKPEEKITVCPFCAKSPRHVCDHRDLYELYDDVFRATYQKIHKKTIPIQSDPKLCTHDDGNLENGFDVIYLIRDAVRRSEWYRLDDGIQFSNIDPDFPDDVISLLRDTTTMEFLFLWFAENQLEYENRNREYHFKSLAKEQIGELHTRLFSLQNLTVDNALEIIRQICGDVDDEQKQNIWEALRAYDYLKRLEQNQKEALEIIRNIELSNIDHTQYKPSSDFGKHFADKAQWPHNKHHLIADHQRFKKWLTRKEAELGKKSGITFCFDIEQEPTHRDPKWNTELIA